MMAALRLVKGRQEMAKSALPAHADRFMRGAHLILQMVQQTALHQFTSPPPENLVVVGTLVSAGEVDNHFASVAAGWEYLKLTSDLLNGLRGRYKTRFCKNSSANCINLFRQRCYDALGTVEDNFPSMGVKKQCCW
ncbi:hypothetical protein PCANC_14875 [Puccinia coronata f. sp. avenae]|uniref:Uncharacterized protein n=1 Tax=Puccinia coronata f. sp. avenae TaxID=200324 RepID=A0A2N5UNQ6_9BASI|nr:hypothetical protein PCANC_14875 [Puccinia coronata f. sp. avenae]